MYNQKANAPKTSDHMRNSPSNMSLPVVSSAAAKERKSQQTADETFLDSDTNSRNSPAYLHSTIGGAMRGSGGSHPTHLTSNTRTEQPPGSLQGRKGSFETMREHEVQKNYQSAFQADVPRQKRAARGFGFPSTSPQHLGNQSGISNKSNRSMNLGFLQRRSNVDVPFVAPSNPRQKVAGESNFSTDDLIIAKNTEFAQNLDAARTMRMNKRMSVAPFRSNNNLSKEPMEKQKAVLYALTYFVCMGLAHVTRSALQSKQVGRHHLDMDDAPLTEEKFNKRITWVFPPEGDMHTGTPGHQFQAFTFSAYAPEIFHRLRNIAGIAEEAYRAECIQNWSLVPFTTNSKSGNFFYHTVGGNYIIKSHSKSEVETLLEMLPGYYAHMLKYKDSLLCKYLGLYKVTSKQFPTVYLIVMKSVYSYTDQKAITKVYDLKGSKVGREAKEKENVKKDNDMVASKESLHLGNEQTAFMAQIRKDSEFLASYNLMDYSMLLAIHDPSDPYAPTFDRYSMTFAGSATSMNLAGRQSMSEVLGLGQFARSEIIQGRDNFAHLVSKKRTHNHLNMPEPPPQEYYLGIIDLLQRYTWRKYFETKLKSFKYKKNEISCVPAETYKSRFVAFLNARVDYIPPQGHFIRGPANTDKLEI